MPWVLLMYCIRPYIKPNWQTGKISLERLAANAKVATVLVSIPASSDTVDSEVEANKAVLNNVHKKKKSNKKFPETNLY
jgi:hypothetical protein